MNYLLSGGIWVLVIFILAILGIGWYLFMKIRYRTVTSNEALIITGPNLGDERKDSNIYKDEQGRYMKIVRGGGHRLRMFQSATKVDLKSFQLEIETPKVYTQQGVDVYGKAVATIKIADKLEGIVSYGEQFLGKKDNDVHEEVSNVLSSNLRAILSKLSVEQINQDRESFNSQVTSIAQDQLDRMGFQITSFGLTDIWDDDNYLENLGRPQTSEVKKNADIAEAENKRETEIKEAEVNEDVSKEQYEREMNIADTKKEKDIKEEKIAAETQREKAAAEASYGIEQEERNLELEERKLRVRQQQKEKDLELERMERDNNVELERKQVEVRKEQAEADYYTKIRSAEAEAEAIRTKSEAEINALKERSKAKSDYQDVILKEKMIDMLPAYAEAISQSLSNVDSIRILDGGKGDQVQSLPKTVTNTMTNLQESLSQMTGFDMQGFLSSLTAGSDESIGHGYVTEGAATEESVSRKHPDGSSSREQQEYDQQAIQNKKVKDKEAEETAQQNDIEQDETPEQKPDPDEDVGAEQPGLNQSHDNEHYNLADDMQSNKEDIEKSIGELGDKATDKLNEELGKLGNMDFSSFTKDNEKDK